MRKTTAYARGRHKEYRICKRLRAEGFLVIRSAGSHTIFDIVAINLLTHEIRLIQSKLGGVGRKEAQRILHEGSKYAGVYNVVFELEQ